MPRPARTAPVAAPAVLAAVLAIAAPASADVLVRTVPGGQGPDAASVLNVRRAADGGVIPLAPTPASGGDPAVPPALSPDGSTLAVVERGRIALVPTAGGPARTIGVPGLHAGIPPVPPSPRTWWNADGSRVAVGSVGLRNGRPGIVTCVVASGACAARTGRGAASGAAVVGATADGRAILTNEPPPAITDRITRYAEPRRATPSGVRRLRRLMRRRFTDLLAVTGRTGAGPVRSWTRTTTAAQGVDELTPSDPGPAGTLVVADRRRFVVRTGHDVRHRPTVRIDTLISSERVWRITDRGERRTVLPASTTRDRVTGIPATVGDGRWLVQLRDGGPQPAEDPKVRLLGADGSVRPLLLQGGPLTGPRLLGAAGLQGAEDGSPPGLDVLGVERAGGDAVVAVDGQDDARIAIVRVPLSGTGAPTLVLQTDPHVATFLSAW